MIKLNRLHIKIRKTNIKKRLFITFISVSILPIILLSCIGYREFVSSFEKKIQESVEQNLKLIKQNIQREVLIYQSLIDDIMLEDLIQEYVDIYETLGIDERTYINTEFNRLIVEKKRYSKYIKNILVVDNAGNTFFEIGYDRIEERRLEGIRENIQESGNGYYWGYVQTYRTPSSLVLGRNIYKNDFSQQILGKIIFFLDEKLFKETVIEKAEIIEGMELSLIDSEGRTITSNNPQIKIGHQYIQDMNNIEEQLQKNNNGVLYTLYDELTRWWLILKIPYTYMNGEVIEIGKKLLFLVGALMMGCLTIVWFIYHSITQPIHEMVAVCKQVDRNNLKVEIEDEGSDEIAYLGKQFNQMLKRVEQLLEIQKQDSFKKRELEMQMLQYQINPHFLFNTLGTLRWVAMVNDNQVVSDGITALAELLRVTLVHKGEYITIEEELENLKNYFEIQKIRYANSFEVFYEIDELLLEHKINKFILQPIAENSILHGIKENNISINIIIRIYALEEDLICIQIRDTGCGFELKEGQTIIEHKAFTGIGIQNVDERIKLTYGRQYGIYTESQKGKGTITHIIIPK